MKGFRKDTHHRGTDTNLGKRTFHAMFLRQQEDIFDGNSFSFDRVILHHAAKQKKLSEIPPQRASLSPERL